MRNREHQRETQYLYCIWMWSINKHVTVWHMRFMYHITIISVCTRHNHCYYSFWLLFIDLMRIKTNFDSIVFLFSDFSSFFSFSIRVRSEWIKMNRERTPRLVLFVSRMGKNKWHCQWRNKLIWNNNGSWCFSAPSTPIQYHNVNCNENKKKLKFIFVIK